jgi:hypothetical protein
VSVNPVTGEPICDENNPDADVRLREDNYDAWRETRAWQAGEDAAEREEREHDRRERDRYAASGEKKSS